MKNYQLFIKYSILIAIINQVACQGSPYRQVRLSRQKRFLIWKPEFNWVQLIAGIGLPSEVKDQSVTLGAAFRAFYLLPTNSSQYTSPLVNYERKKRSASRWVLYTAFEKFIESFGYGDGKECMMKTICEAASKPFDKRSGLLAEIAHAFLTPSSTEDIVEDNSSHEYHAAEKLGSETDRCEILFPACYVNVMDHFSKYLS